jgi:DNA-binding beta-propeller fold protein YncE
MKSHGLSLLFSCFLVCCAEVTSSMARQDIVVTNRGGASISVINAATHNVTHYPLPAGNAVPEPMYASFIPASRQLHVGDRANNRVVVFNALDYSVLGSIPVGAGVFHQWAEPSRGQLWVNNDVDKTISIINTSTNNVITTVSTPTDLNNLGGKPHDVILDPTGPFAYVTMITVAGQNDYVVKYSTETFLEVDRAPVGKDPHVSLTAANNLLYVPTQNANEVRVLDRGTLDFVTSIPIPNAHGAGMMPDGSRFYTTNIAGGGVNGLVTINTATNAAIDSDSTSFGTPHNIAITSDQTQLFLTHSGATSTAVSIFDLANDGSPDNPGFIDSVNVGLNPWGIVAFSVLPEPHTLALALTLVMASFPSLRHRGFHDRRRLGSDQRVCTGRAKNGIARC